VFLDQGSWCLGFNLEVFRDQGLWWLREDSSLKCFVTRDCGG
jgi:hypothetical protein